MNAIGRSLIALILECYRRAAVIATSTKYMICSVMVDTTNEAHCRFFPISTSYLCHFDAPAIVF